MNANLDRWEAERRAEDESRARFAVLADEVAAELGAVAVQDCWREGADRDASRRWVSLADGGRVALVDGQTGAWPRKPGRIVARWSGWPTRRSGNGLREVLPGDVVEWRDGFLEVLPSFEATISTSKGAARIAREIERRVIEVARPWVKRCQERADIELQSMNTAVEAATRIGLQVGVQPTDAHRFKQSSDGREVTLFPHSDCGVYGIRVQAYEGRVSVTFERVESMGEARALRVLAALREVTP